MAVEIMCYVSHLRRVDGKSEAANFGFQVCEEVVV